MTSSELSPEPSPKPWWALQQYSDALCHLHVLGNWDPDLVRSEWQPSTMRHSPEQLAAIDRAWILACARPGVHLFDGALCRLESFTNHSHELANGLTIGLSATGYKAFLGTNGSHPEWADTYGHTTLAAALGTSAALISSDGWIVCGRRSPNLALYPDYPHPVGGTCEINGDIPPSISTELLRELHEEVGLLASEITDVRVIALAEDRRLRQPEMIWLIRTCCSRENLEQRIAHDEHTAAWSIRADPQVLYQALVPLTDMTPVMRATLLAYGWHAGGDSWLDSVRSGLKNAHL